MMKRKKVEIDRSYKTNSYMVSKCRHIGFYLFNLFKKHLKFPSYMFHHHLDVFIILVLMNYFSIYVSFLGFLVERTVNSENCSGYMLWAI